MAVQPSTAIVHIEAHILYAYENELVHKMLGKLGSGVKYVATYVCVHDLLSLMVCVYMHVLDWIIFIVVHGETYRGQVY